MIRARERQHLEDLKTLAGEDFGPVLESEEADYRFRIVTNRQTWHRVATKLADDVMYPNFKEACTKNKAFLGVDYIEILVEVWGIMWHFQESVLRKMFRGASNRKRNRP